MWVTRPLWTLVVLGALGFASAAHADVGRLVLVDPDPELAAAVHGTLAAWELEIVVATGESPASMPEATQRGRALAERERADAVVWISVTASGPALWVYDVETERIAARALEVTPPFDEATAAAVALTIKTLLRHSAIAPTTERDVPEPDAVPEPEAGPEPEAQPPEPEPQPEPDPVAPITDPHRAVRIALGGGLLALATGASEVEPRFVLGLSVWPAELGGHVGVALSARTGPGVELASDRARGRFTHSTLSVGGRLRLTLDPVDLGVGLDVGVRLTTLDTTLGSGAAVFDLRLAFAGLGWAEVGVRLDPTVRLAARVGAEVGSPAPSYVVQGQPVLVVEPAAFLAEVLVEVALP